MPATPAASADARAEVAATALGADIDLGFEGSDGAAPRGWSSGILATASSAQPGYAYALDANHRHGGTTSLRIERVGEGDFGSMAAAIDAAPVRGKTLRLHGWITTQDVSAWAGLWLRADGASIGAFDNLQGRGPSGTTDWHEVIAEIDVPGDATTVTLGPLIVGTGTAWFDDLRLEVIEPGPITIAGVVRSADGTPVAGAIVSRIRPGGAIEEHVTTDDAGRFAFATTSGRWGLSAHHATAGVGAFRDGSRFVEDTADLTLTLGAQDGITVRGRVVGDALPSGAHLQLSPPSNHDADLYAVPVATDGSFNAILPDGAYDARLPGSELLVDTQSTRTGKVLDLTVHIARLAPPPDEVVTWLKSAVAPLISAEAGHGFDDLAPLGEAIGDARMVALGEATHGTREFFQLKHRVLEYLVAEHGFTLFAIEANLPECRAINDYVLHGKGDPQQALDGIYFWVWNTEEVLAMIEWMRAWNADPKHERKVQFVGFDMQFTKGAMENLAAFLERVGAPDRVALLEPLQLLVPENSHTAIRNATKEQRAAVAAALTKLGERFDRSRRRWRNRAGARAFDDARRDVVVLEQAMAQFSADASTSGYWSGFDARDAAMAANARWWLAQGGKGARMVLWAHNGHVSTDESTVTTMGEHLRQGLGADYVSIGFVFSHGSFQARAMDGRPGVMEHTVNPPPDSDVSTAFVRTDHPLSFVDLRRAPAGAVADWFAAKHPMREAGSGHGDEASMAQPQALSRRFDAVLFVERTTRARPNPGGIRTD